jgi:hypothetical protein
MTRRNDLEDELKKLGLRIRPRVVRSAPEQRPGHIAFDDRGNAVYEWNAQLDVEGEDGERARQQALEHPGLSLVDDEPANAPIRNNVKGARLGYNPYESGLLTKREARKKRDLRELSKWLETKRRLAEKVPEDQ